MDRHTALIISEDPMAAALIGMVVERARMQPSFSAPGESATDALRRHGELLLVLVDSASEVMRSDLFVRVVQARNAGLAVFAGGKREDTHRERAAPHVPLFAVPAQLETLHAWLLAYGDASGGSRERGAERRIAPMAMRSADGAMRFRDARGMDWSVYDRRTEDRRKGVVTERHFVNHRAEERTCLLQQSELDDFNVVALEAQLGRATRVDH